MTANHEKVSIADVTLDRKSLIGATPQAETDFLDALSSKVREMKKRLKFFNRNVGRRVEVIEE